MKKTKIIATIGPASKDKIILEEMILNGMDVARFNMKYSSLEFCQDIIYKIRDIDRKLKTSTAILMDLEGPNIRVGKFLSGEAEFNQNDKIRIYMNPIIGDSTKFSISYSDLINDIKMNSIIKIKGSLIELKVLEKELECLICEVLIGGKIKSNDSLCVLDAKLNISFITENDKKNIEFANKENIDYLSLSLVSNSEDVLSINDLLIASGNDHISIITKIEKAVALEDLDEIIKVSDGIIVDRNDLGIEMPYERILGIQKTIINRCYLNAKLSIIATEMESMETEIIPTKLEVNDIVNAVSSGIDAIMLSGETTKGKYPVGTITTINKIIKNSELDINYSELLDKAMRTENQDITNSIAYSVVECSKKLECIAIVAPTISGYTAKKISRFRPKCPVIAITPNIETAKNLGMYHGVYPVLVDEVRSFDAILRLSKNIIMKKFNYQNNDKIIITGGYPFEEVKHTNFMKIEEL